MTRNQKEIIVTQEKYPDDALPEKRNYYLGSHIQCAIDIAIEKGLASEQTEEKFDMPPPICIPPGKYLIEEPLRAFNAEGYGIKGLHIYGAGKESTILVGRTNNRPVLDLTGNRETNLHDFQIEGSATGGRIPSAGIVIGRTSVDTGTYNYHSWRRISINNHFNVCGIYVSSQERSEFKNIDISLKEGEESTWGKLKVGFLLAKGHVANGTQDADFLNNESNGSIFPDIHVSNQEITGDDCDKPNQGCSAVNNTISNCTVTCPRKNTKFPAVDNGIGFLIWNAGSTLMMNNHSGGQLKTGFHLHGAHETVMINNKAEPALIDKSKYKNREKDLENSEGTSRESEMDDALRISGKGTTRGLFIQNFQVNNRVNEYSVHACSGIKRSTFNNVYIAGKGMRFHDILEQSSIKNLYLTSKHRCPTEPYQIYIHEPQYNTIELALPEPPPPKDNRSIIVVFHKHIEKNIVRRFYPIDPTGKNGRGDAFQRMQIGVDKLGFHNAEPIEQQIICRDFNALFDALVNLGLIAEADCAPPNFEIDFPKAFWPLFPRRPGPKK